MATSPETPVTREAIRAALRAAAEDFLRRIGEEHPGETLYGFLLEISPSGFSAHGAAATEEGLARYSERWVAEGKAEEGETLETVTAMFRWGSPEDAWYQQPDAAFDAVNELLGRAGEEGLYERYDGTLETTCIAVLKEMDGAGVFGMGADRERVALGLCYIGGDNSAKEFLGWARQANPRKVYRRLRREYLGGE